MNPYINNPDDWIKIADKSIAVFREPSSSNIDLTTVESFGEEWSRFNHFDDEELKLCGDEYFDITDASSVSKNTLALDLGCGSGRWSRYLAPHVKFIEAVDPSEAVLAASKNLEDFDNVRVTKASVDNLPFADNSFDLIFSLGVLHHIPDTGKAIVTATKKLKPDGYFLLYLYYRFDNRGMIFKSLFYLSHIVRLIVSKSPKFLKQFLSELIALFVYMPFVIFARLVKSFGGSEIYESLPLAYYVDKSFYIIRNDSLDRFGTPLEQRFTKKEITNMLEVAGMKNIVFSEQQPYWHVIAQKK
jgi:SAM-dependent methyltransferase